MPELFGKYVFGDFQGGFFGARLFIGDLITGEMAELQVDPAGEDLPDFIYSFGQGDDNELYLLGGPEGVVLRFAPPVETTLGDYDGSGVADGHDFLRWQRIDVTALGIDIWERGFAQNGTTTQIPEPSTATMVAVAGLALLRVAVRRRGRLARQFPMPNEERVAMCRQAWHAAERDAERRLVLEVVKRYPSVDMLRLAVAAADFPSLKEWHFRQRRNDLRGGAL